MTNTTQQLPHRRMEAWKWTDVSRATSDQTGLSSAAELSWNVPEGVSHARGEGHVTDAPMAKLAAQFAGEAYTFYVPAGTDVREPLGLFDVGAGHAHVAIMIDKGASLTLIEDYASDTALFSNIDMHIHVANGAQLTRIVTQSDADDALRMVTTTIATEQDAVVNQFILSFGGALTRLETRLFAEGDSLTASLNGAYLLDRERHTDMTSHVQLKEPHSTIRQSVKGVVTDKARGVFQGKFFVERPAQHTDAEMRHDALMLSDTAEVRAKPELEIYADDVACAHGNTLGALDEQALFYMQQRGIPKAQARALLTEAFVTEVFDDLALDTVKEKFLGRIANWLKVE